MSDCFIDKVRVLCLRYGGVNKRGIGGSVDWLEFTDF